MSFYFPYNFYPVTGKINGVSTPRYTFDYTRENDATGKPTTANLARHDIWQKDTYTGHFVVNLKTVSPLVVGNTHSSLPNNANRVSPYKWKGEIALPANSLRGMIASIAETLSQSTLRVLDEKFYPAFEENIDKDMTPWKRSRKQLTPAELLFGVVDEEGGNTDEGAKNLASRVRFHDGILVGSEKPVLFNQEITLKELSSPKFDGQPERPFPNQNNDAYNHYFRRKDHNYATHNDVLRGTMDKLLPLGRKFYLTRKGLHLHHYSVNGNADRKMKCTPINAETNFIFKVGFNNLTKSELCLLKTSIKPDSFFLHHLGLGKALGLGAVQLTIKEINYIDKSKRYGLDALTEGGETLLEEDTLNNRAYIDVDTLRILTMANDLRDLPNAEDVDWRNGRNETSRPVPTITANQTVLPLAEGLGTDLDNTSAPQEKLITQNTIDKSLADLDTQAASWLIERIEQFTQIENFSGINNEQIKTILIGKALSRAYIDIPDDNLKEEVLELIQQQFKERSIMKNELTSVAERRYFPT